MSSCSRGSRTWTKRRSSPIYIRIYEIALVIPVVSVAGVLLSGILKRRELKRLRSHGIDAVKAVRYGSRPGRAHLAQLVDPRRQPGVRDLHHHHGPDRGALQPGNHLCGLDAHHPVSHQPPAEGTRTRGPQRAARHGHHYLRLPRHAHARCGPDLVDDRRARFRPAVPVGAVADQQRTGAVRHVHLPPLHGGEVHRLYRGVPHPHQHPADLPDHRHVLRAARMDGGASRAASSMRTSSRWWTRRSSRRSARWR